MAEESKPHRTRFARLYSDGTMGVEQAGADFLTARQRLTEGHDDPDVELLEIEIVVIRSHGRPRLRAVTDRHVTCPTCGEEIYVEETADGELIT